MVDLSAYKNIESVLLARITVDEYKADANDEYHQEILKFNDSQTALELILEDGTHELFVGLGNFVSISSTKSELRASSGDLTIGISGIPDSAISEIVNSRLKGSKVEIYRAVVNSSTRVVIATVGRYFGIVNNYSLVETWDLGNGTNMINIICKSHIDNLQNQIKGRRTNPYDEALYFPNDKGFTRVPSLIDATYDFGGSTTTK